jgi:hypothetical protein
MLAGQLRSARHLIHQIVCFLRNLAHGAQVVHVWTVVDTQKYRKNK